MIILNKILTFGCLMIFTSCKAQEKTGLPKGKDSTQITDPDKTTKMIKTQGANEYASIYDALQDKDGNIWFATPGEGVYRYDGQYFVQFTEKDGLGSNYVYCIMEDRSGNIWFGTADGANYYDGKKFTHISISTIKNDHLPHQKTKVDLYGVPIPYENYVWSLLQDQSGTIWLSTFDKVYRYNPATLPGTGEITFTEFLQSDGVADKTNGEFKSIENMVEDHEGNIWFGGRKTVGVYRYDGKELVNLKVNDNDWLMPELVGKNGAIYFWGSDLPFKYNGESFTRFPKETFADWVYEVGEDKDGHIWFGHLGVGVYKYDGENFTYFGAKEGFDKKGVSCIFTDKKGYTWFGTKNLGLIRYDGKTFINFSE